MKDPYAVVKSRYITEKTTMLEELQNRENNRCLKRCKTPKYVFIVDKLANKSDIARAVEEIYKEEKIKVIKVNTLHGPRKTKKRGRGRIGHAPSFKKAVVTMEPGDVIE